MKIVKKKKIKESPYRFDISVKDTHNFVSCGVVVHNTSAHVKIIPSKKENGIELFSGGVSSEQFDKLVRPTVVDHCQKNYDELPMDSLSFTLYGEAYGGSCQKMSNVYGKDLKFVVFDVKIETELHEVWLNVPNAEDVTKKMGLEFVHYVKIPATLENINTERDKPSVQASRNGMGNDKWSEGVVLRPLIELTKNNGSRLICKHKRDEYRETKTKRKVSPEQLEVLENAKDIADEWVTEMRLIHALDKLGGSDMTIMPRLIPYMIEDIKREAEGEIVWSKEVSTAITRKTGQVLKEYLQSNIVT